MYQIRYQGGYDIEVLGRGERASCRVTRHNEVQFEGTYAACCGWLADRGVREHPHRSSHADEASAAGR